MSGSPVAGWYRDPSGEPGRIRFFDGRGWTSQVRTVPTDPHPPATGPAAATAAVAAECVVDPQTAQALVADTLAGWRPKPRPRSADPGWYNDPGRSRKLRFYDGEGWTARTRDPLDNRRRNLPRAALALRARMLEIADAQAARSGTGARWRTVTHAVAAPQPLPRANLVVRSRSGRVGGMVSMAAIVSGVCMVAFAGWQQWGAPALSDGSQDQLRAELVTQFRAQGGDFTAAAAGTSNGSEHTGTGPDAGGPGSAEGSAGAGSGSGDAGGRGADGGAPDRAGDRDRAAGGGVSGAGRPRLNSRPDDLSPFPPRSWSPQRGRRARTLAGYDSGEPVGRLIVPRLGLDEVMVAGTGMNELAKGPGVARYGMLPGSPGNAVVAGHRTGWGEPFRHLERLRYGDRIIVEVPGQPRAVYEVRSRTVVSPYNTAVVEQTGGVRLTLTTCHPVSVNTHRMIVQAEMVSGAWLDRAVNRSRFRTLR